MASRLRIISTSTILSATKASEYNALTSGQKDYFRMIISCGHFNAASGSKIRDALLSMFGEGTETREAIVEIIGVELPIEEP